MEPAPAAGAVASTNKSRITPSLDRSSRSQKTSWIVDNLQVVISGSLSDDEINSMIDSINEG